MYSKERLFTNDKSPNIIIINKDGMNEEEDNRKKRKSNAKKFGTIITLKGEEFTLKMNLLNTNDINREKILKTVTNMKKHLIDSESGSTIKENDYKKINKKFFHFNNIINYNKNNLKINRDISEGSMKESNKPNICKTNNEADKYTEYEGKKKLLINGLKSSLNEDENNQNNNISIYEFNKNENSKIKESSIIYNEDNYCKVINNTNHNIKDNSFKKNININNGNRIKFKNNFINNYNNNNANDISSSIKTNVNNIYNENVNDNISENKKLIIIKKSKKFKKPSFLEQNNNIEIYNNKQKNNNIPSKFSHKDNLIEKNNIPQIINENKRMKCFICEKIFKINKIFSPKCQIHNICIKCIKSYYEEKFENNNFSLKCPDANCNQEFDFNILKDIISLNHFEMFLNNPQEEDKIKTVKNNNYINNTKEMFLKDSKILFNSKMNNENIKIYSQKHVLDINSNEKFFMYKKNKDLYCYKCLKPTLFTKINGYFIKCLNCHFKICKYCLKEFKDFHMDLLTKDHCKVYYRKEDLYLEYYFQKKKKIILYLTQLFYVIAMYYLMFAGVYFLVYTFLKKPIRLTFLRLIYYSFISLISFLILIICSPFLIIFYPFLPIMI